MFLELLEFLTSIDNGFAVFNYLTTRIAFTLITALLIMLAFGGVFIRTIQSLQFGQVVRTDGVQSHLKKTGTPTMGGVLIIFSLVISSLIWGDLSNIYLWIVLFVAVSFATIGFIDDYKKVALQSSDGLSPKQKLGLQLLFSSITIWLLVDNNLVTFYQIPFIKEYWLDITSVGFILLSIFLLVGFSNAVNLTDGLDGLAIMPTVIIAGGLMIFAYISSNSVFTTHLNMEYMPHTTEMLIILAALIGSGLGFLWFNTYPAQIFMGDVGSLSLGAILITIAIILRIELVFIIMGFVFVIEALSVMLQVGYFKWSKFKYGTGKRLLRMAPIHHHFEQKGVSEPKIIVRAWLITLALVLVALATIKIR
jgi:phospho-N-acetylmuramoyl-pentapeptide-transferase